MKKEGIDEEKYDRDRGCGCAHCLSSNRIHSVISQRILDLIVSDNAMCNAADVAHFKVLAMDSPVQAKIFNQSNVSPVKLRNCCL